MRLRFSMVRALVVFFAVAWYPLGATRFLWVGYPLLLAAIVGVWLALRPLNWAQNTPFFYALLYGIGTIWLIVTSALSGAWANPSNVLPFMGATAMFLFGVAVSKDRVNLLYPLLFGSMVAGLLTAMIVYMQLGMDYFRSDHARGALYLATLGDDWVGGNRNAIGRNLLAGLVAGGTAIVFGPRHWRPYLLGVIAVLTVFIFGTYSGRSIFGAVLVLIGLAVYFNGQRTAVRKLSGTRILLILSVVVLSVLIFQYFSAQIYLMFSKMLSLVGLGNVNIENLSPDAAQGRRELIAQGFELFGERPFLGFGLENSRNFMATFTHVDYLELLISGGILAPMFFYLAYFMIATTVWRMTARDRWVALAAMFFLLAVFSQGMAGALYKVFLVHVNIMSILLGAIHYRLRMRTKTQRKEFWYGQRETFGSAAGEVR